MNTFDPSTHSYTIAGRPVPNNTHIIQKILGDAIWHASEWQMQRGRVVHACAAFVAQGKNFEHSPEVAGQVAACRLFFAENEIEVLEVEQPIFSERYQFGTTLDLHCLFRKRNTIIDWKPSLSKVSEIQIGGCAIERPEAKWGMVVALKENGKYKCGEMFKLERRKNEFLALRSVYGIRQRLGLSVETEGMKQEREGA